MGAAYTASFAVFLFSVLCHRKNTRELEEQRKKEGGDNEKGEPAPLSLVI